MATKWKKKLVTLTHKKQKMWPHGNLLGWTKCCKHTGHSVSYSLSMMNVMTTKKSNKNYKFRTMTTKSIARIYLQRKITHKTPFSSDVNNLPSICAAESAIGVCLLWALLQQSTIWITKLRRSKATIQAISKAKQKISKAKDKIEANR